jgi:hypothetical protein
MWYLPLMTTTTTRYEHRLTEAHNAGEHYCGDLIIPAGLVLEKTRTPNRYRNYIYKHTMHEIFDVPTEKVGVFKITRTVTETEEML